MVGKVAVGGPVGGDQLEPQALEHRADHRPRHAVAPVAHHLHRPHPAGIDELQGGLLELGIDVDFLARAAAGGIGQAGLERAPDVLDAPVSGQGDRSALDHLGPGVRLGVVRGGAHQAPVQAAGADQVIEHLGAHLTGVEYVHALGEHPLAVARRHLGRAQAHVAPQAEGQIARPLARQLGDDAGKAAPELLGQVAVDLLAVEPTHVVGLEDLGGDGHRGHPRERATPT